MRKKQSYIGEAVMQYHVINYASTAATPVWKKQEKCDVTEVWSTAKWVKAFELDKDSRNVWVFACMYYKQI